MNPTIGKCAVGPSQGEDRAGLRIPTRSGSLRLLRNTNSGNDSRMLRVPNQSQRPTHYEWTPAELVRTNDSVVVSAIEALLTGAHIPYLITDHNVSVLAGSVAALPRRIIVGNCCVSDARRLLAAAEYGRELSLIGGEL